MPDPTPHAVITGGASGIGLAVARQMLSQGVHVTMLDLHPSGEEIARDVGADFRRLDVSDADAVETVADELQADNPPTILVTSAGILQRMDVPERISWKEWDRVTATHQRGTFACCRSFGSRMAARGAGSVVTISSVAGIATGPLHAYGPAKAAIAHLSMGLAAEWGPSGVRVNSVAPGFTATPALERGLAAGALENDRLAEGSALGRLVAAEEIAQAVAFLAGPLASAITGVVLPVDCGYLVARDWAVYGGLR